MADRLKLTSGFGRVLVMVYAVFAISATGRSTYQIIAKFDNAPVAFSLSALAAVIYIVATIAIAKDLHRLAFASIAIELVGVIAVGAWSLLSPETFPEATVWSNFGSGYGYVPLLLPLVGLWWLSQNRKTGSSA